MVAHGMCFSVALTADGHVFTTGENTNGVLGQGDNINRNTFTRINQTSFDNLEIGMIATGLQHVLALARHGGNSVYTWGENHVGETGHQRVMATSNLILAPTKLPDDSFGNVAVTMMDAHSRHSVVVSIDGVLWGTGFHTWGTYSMRRLGGEEIFGGDGVRMAACGLNFTLVVTKNNTLWKLTSYSFHYLAPPNRIGVTRFKQNLFAGDGIMVAAAGSSHSAALTTQGRLYAWDESENTVPQLHRHWILTNVPQRIVMDFPVTLRFGRWHALHPDGVFAFVMGLYDHLAAAGGRTAYSQDDFPEDLLQTIMEHMHLRSRPGTSDGFQDMLGRVL
jgi:alpha-tubulin suppressor-like RCC1 family protein